MKCQVIGFDCPAEDLCPHCKGTGNEPREELCQNCDECFDERLGWSTGIRQGSASQRAAWDLVERNQARETGQTDAVGDPVPAGRVPFDGSKP